LFGIVAALMLGLGTSFGVAGADGPDCGGQAGGRRYSTAAQAAPATVRSLEQAWTFRTGGLGDARVAFSPPPQ
jgi:glucose dehydrogenase